MAVTCILQRIPEHIPDIDYATLKEWEANGLIFPTRRDEVTNLEMYSADSIVKNRHDIESKYEAIVERQNLEQRAKTIAQELEAAQARARQTGNPELVLRATKLMRERRDIESRLKPVAKAPDIATLQTELQDVRQQRQAAEARAKQTVRSDDIFEFQRLNRRCVELEALIRNAK